MHVSVSDKAKVYYINIPNQTKVLNIKPGVCVCLVFSNYLNVMERENGNLSALMKISATQTHGRENEYLFKGKQDQLVLMPGTFFAFSLACVLGGGEDDKKHKL